MCVECDGKGTFDIMINVRPSTMARQGHSVSWRLCKICLWELVVFVLGIKSCLCVRQTTVQKLMC